MSAKTKIIITAVIVAVVSGLAVTLLINTGNETPLRTTKAVRQDVVQDVAFTGHLASKQSSNLSFESTGAVSQINVSVGDKVLTGQPLARLETRIAEINTAKAFADRSSGQELKKIALEKAESAWENTKAANAATIETKKQTVRDEKAELDQYRAVHQKVAAEQGENDSVTSTYQTSVKLAETAYRNAQNALAEAVKSAAQSEAAARQAANLARAEYQATLQASDGVAGLSNLEATEALSQHQLTKKTLTAPFDGVITRVEKELGETTTIGETVITVETVDQLELKANITETDAAKIAENMEATINFDALPIQDTWSAKIYRISPAATVNEGVPTYEVILRLTENDSRFRPGLTANITVHADAKYNVIAIPRRTVSTKGENQLVNVLNEDGSITEQKVTTGLIGTAGTIEVTSGITEGQEVLIDSGQLEQ